MVWPGVTGSANPLGPAVLSGSDMRVRQGVPVDTVSLATVYGGRAATSCEIDDLRHELDVIGVDAKPVPAEMIGLEVRGDVADQQCVGEPVREHRTPLMTESEHSVAVRGP